LLKRVNVSESCPLQVTYLEEVASTPTYEKVLQTAFKPISPFPQWTSINCKIPEDECEQLFTQFYSRVDSFLDKLQGQTFDDAARRESVLVQPPPCPHKKVGTCEDCFLFADHVSVYYSPVHVTRDMCATIPRAVQAVSDSVAKGG
jgi:hypothetical protein